MRYKFFVTIMLSIIALSACVPMNTSTIVSDPTISKVPSLTFVPGKTGSLQIKSVTPTPTIQGIQQYADVRGKDLSGDGELGETLLTSLWFDQDTVWSPKDQVVADNILSLGMNPGMGVQKLHEEGITGKGVTVAIIDQNLALNHIEFQNKVIKYVDFGTESPADIGSMHGAAVTSLLVGNNIGTAPEAKVYYAAVPSWKADAQYYADALDWIIAENAKLPEENKIRVVSISAAPSGIWTEFTKNTESYDAAYQRAMEAGILVLDITFEHGITLTCTSNLHDSDKINSCIPNWNPPPTTIRDRINIPTTRTTAEEKEKNYEYQFTGYGGMSWTTPYLAGVLAMGWQVNPQLTNSEIVDILYDSAYEMKTGEKIIDPQAFIDKIKHTMNE
jgi:subtilisin family serine protease